MARLYILYQFRYRKGYCSGIKQGICNINYNFFFFSWRKAVSLNKTSVTGNGKVVETIEAKLKDQYGNDMNIKAKVENSDDKAKAPELK